MEDVDMSVFRQSGDNSMLAPIKRMVKEYGAAGLSFDALNGLSPTIDSRTYNAANNCYYNNGNGIAGHAVVIVGWDDNFSKENFSVAPPGDGAFLIRNSWMDEEDDHKESFSGYCWMSYYEKTLRNRFFSVEMDTSDNYDNNYQYDIYSDAIGGYYQVAANVFTAHAKGEVNGENLRAVSFYTNAANAAYTVEIYTDCEDTPDSGNMCEEATIEDVTGFAGYYTVELPVPVHVDAGSKYAVVVSFDCNAIVKEGTYATDVQHAGSEPGQSYYYMLNEWFNTDTSGNFKIKAFTDNDTSGEYVAPTDISFTNIEDNSLSIGAGEVFKVNADVLPESASQKVTWRSSDESVARVSGGQIEGVKEGTAEITASAADGSVEKKIAVTVCKKLVALSVTTCRVIDFLTGEEYIQYEAHFSPADYVPVGKVVWSVADEDVISVAENGRITQHMMGKTEVTATLDGVSIKDTFTVRPSSDFFGFEVGDGKSVTLKWKAAKNAVSYNILRDGKTIVVEDDGSSSYEYVDEYYVGTDTTSATYYFGPDYGAGAIRYPFRVGLGQNYSITYHLNDGEQNPDNPTKYTSGNEYKLHAPTPPFGYRFAAWYTDPEFSSAGYMSKITEETTGDLDLYAKYLPLDPALTVEPQYVTLSKGQSAEVTATYVPAYGTEKYSFISFNTDIATVTSEGNTATITAGQREGQTVIQIKCEELTTYVNVVVAQVITLDETDITLRSEEGMVKELTAQVADSYAGQPIDWTSSDESVATVEGGRVVPAAGLTEAGQAVITASVRGTEYSDSCTVTVVPQYKLSEPVGFIDDDAEEYDGSGVVKGSILRLKCGTFGASIFYALDGKEPSVDSEGNPQDADTVRYEEAIVIDRDMAVKAISWKKGNRTSSVASFALSVKKDDWEDVEDEALRSGLFENDSSEVPNGVWYIFGNTEDGFESRYYTSSSELDIHKVYSGAKISFNRDICVYHGTRKLVEGRDYTVSYKNNISPSGAADKNAPTVTVKGKGSYTSTAQFKFTIDKAPMSAAELSSETEIAVMTGSRVKLSSTKPVLKFAGKPLKTGKDYTLSYYEGDENGRLIEDPSKEILSEAGKTYTIEISAAAGGRFTDDTDPETCAVIRRKIRVVTRDPQKSVSVTKLKIVDAKGKAVKIPYREEGYTIDELFDNRPGEGDPEPSIFVKDGKTVLTYGEDFLVEPVEETGETSIDGSGYTFAGRHKFVIVGIDKADPDKVSYVGKKTVGFEITGIPMSKVKIAGLRTSTEYTGAEITLDDLFNSGDKNLEGGWDKVTLFYKDSEGNKRKLRGPEDTEPGGIEPGDSIPDYSVLFENTGYPGKYSLVFTGRNRFSGSIKKTVTVKPFSVKNNAGNRIAVEVSDAVFSKAGAVPSVKVRFVISWNEDGSAAESILLKEGVDYTLSYKNNGKAVPDEAELLKLKASKRPTVTIKGIGNFTGSSAVATFIIKKAPISSAELIASDVNYNAKGRSGYFLSVPKLYQDGKALTVGAGKDIDSFDKNTVEYTYGEDTVLGDGAYAGDRKFDGERVLPTDKVNPGTLIRVSLRLDRIAVGEKSSFTNEEIEGAGDVVLGYYRVVDPAMSIGRWKAELKNKERLSFNSGDAVVLRESDISVYRVVGGVREKLNVSDFRIRSVKGHRFIGKTVIVLEGRGRYCGTKTITLKLSARKMAAPAQG